MIIIGFRAQMDKLEELLPGIEQFLCDTLPKESLSVSAEQKCKYYMERLEVLKLPPSLPPRPSAVVSAHEENSGLEKTKVSVIVHATDEGKPVSEKTRVNARKYKSAPVDGECVINPPDFAAFQRELARSFVTKNSDSEEEAKVYDDIEASHCEKKDKIFDQDLYEIPVTQPSDDSQAAEGLSHTTSGSTEEISEEIFGHAKKPQQPPPLPPKPDRLSSDPPSQNSPKSSGPPQLPARPPLATRSEIYAMSSERSEKSEDHTDDNTDDDRTSYESYDAEHPKHDVELLSKLNIKLPKNLKKTRKLKRLSRSRSSSQWDINLPFRKLESIVLSGELYHKRKLSWNKMLVAVSAGRLVCYKSEKEPRANIVVPLTGYEANMFERDGRHGYEIKLTHENAESYSFAIDFKEWAQVWCEYINTVAEGKTCPPIRHPHLARRFTSQLESSTYSQQNYIRGSVSNLSNGSSDHGSHSTLPQKIRKEYFTGNRVTRMGSFAYKATQFFETIGHRKGIRKLLGSGRSKTLIHSPKKNCTLPSYFSYPADQRKKEAEKMEELSIKCKSYLNIFSSYNKRHMGKRWCKVRQNMFECYKNEQSHVCELDFLLKDCFVRHAAEETKSKYGLMITQDGVEKITMEPLSENDMREWLTVLMEETSTRQVPAGLDMYFEEQPYSDIPSGRQYSTVKEEDSQKYFNIEDDIVETKDESGGVIESLDRGPDDSDFRATLYTKVQNKGSISSAADNRPSLGLSTTALNGEMATVHNNIKRDSVSSEMISDSRQMAIARTESEFSKDASMCSSDISRSSIAKVSNNGHWTSDDSQSCSEVFSEKEIETLMKSWNIQTRISSLEESCTMEQQDVPIAVHSRNFKSSTKRNFVTTSKSASFLSRFASDSDENSDSVFLTADSFSTKGNHHCVEHNGFLPDSCLHLQNSVEQPGERLQHKLEELRAKLVELKQKRIAVRDKKLLAESDEELQEYEEQYSSLDQECRSTDEEIVKLEQMLREEEDRHMESATTSEA